MKKVLVLLVTMLLLATSVFAHGAHNFPSCQRDCRERQHDKQSECIQHFNHEYQECKEEFSCGTSQFRHCKQDAYDEKQECMDETDVWYDQCVGN